MKKRFLSLALTLMLCFGTLFAFASCSIPGSTPCTTHSDANSDHKCDTCKKEISTCADADSNHTCDVCSKDLSECEDEDKNHACDICGETSECADGDSNHLCDICEETLTECEDADENNLCDICGSSMAVTPENPGTAPDGPENPGTTPDDPENPGTDPENPDAPGSDPIPVHDCYDAQNDHLCDVCKETLTECFDSLTGTGSFSICDICGKTLAEITGPDDSELIPNERTFLGIALRNDGEPTADVFLPFFRDSYDIYLVFSVKTTEILTDSFGFGTVVYGEGYMKNGRWIVPAAVNSKDTVTTVIPGSYPLSLRYKYEGQPEEGYLSADMGLHVIGNCNAVPSFLGASLDGNPENATKSLTFRMSDVVLLPDGESFSVYLHFDGIICMPYVNSRDMAGTAEPYAYYNTYTVKLDAKFVGIGEISLDLSFVYGPSKSLSITLKNAVSLSIQPCEKCDDANKDGTCDICLSPVKGDGSGEIHECKDADKNHICDNGCADSIGDHKDDDRDHICDYGCTDRIGEHFDADKNHICDYGCTVPFGTHEDTNNNHICDYGCSERIGACFDDPMDGDHFCDHGCGEILTECADVTVLDGICDDCGASLGGSSDPETNAYFEFVAALTFDDKNCPTWRVAIVPTQASYIFVSRELAKGEWFCGSEILFLMRLAYEMRVKLELVPMYGEDALAAVESGFVDALAGPTGYSTAGTSIPSSETYGANFRVFTTSEHHLSMINKAIDFIRAENIYGAWYAAAAEYAASLPASFVDTDGYTPEGEKVNGDADCLCNHKDADNDHYCEKCREVASYCIDKGNGYCSYCGAPVSDLSSPTAAPVFLGVALTPDGDYSKATPMRIFYILNKECTVYYKFSNAVTLEFGFAIAGARPVITEVQSDLGAYIYAVSFTVTNERDEHGLVDNIFFLDVLGEYTRLPNLNYYRIPELIGMADENGVLISYAPDIAAGASFTLRFVTLGEIEELKLFFGGTALDFTVDSTELFYFSDSEGTDGFTPYYIYTVTVTDGSFIPAGNGEITLDYTYYGIDSGDFSPFPPMLLTFYKHTDGGAGGGEGGEMIPPCETCSDGNGDGYCDLCFNPVQSIPEHECTDEEDYDTYCDVCYEPIKGLENLLNPYLIGYSSEPGGPFEESSGLLSFEYYKRNLVYLKFNCRVELISLSILETPIEELIFISEDESGCIYSFWTPDIDSIFAQRGAELYFKTPYSSECFASILYSCIPTVMPEFLGMVENGFITQNAVTLPKGFTYTFSFAMNVEVDSLDAITTYYCELELVEWSCIQGGEGEYIYTVTVRDSYGSIADGVLLLQLYYTYLGASNGNSGDSAFPPVFYLSLNITELCPVAISVNGCDLLSQTQIPYAGTYIFTVIFNLPPEETFIEINGQIYYGVPDFSFPGTYIFTVSEFFFGYQQIYIHSSVGEYAYMPIMLDVEFLGYGEGGGIGGEGAGGEGGEIGPMPEESVEVLSIQNAVFEEPVEKGGVIRAYADGKIAIDVTLSREVEDSYMRVNGDYISGRDYYNGVWFFSLAHPMGSSVQEGAVEICIYENGVETVIETLSFRIAAAEFYGIYTEPGAADIETRPSWVNVAANEIATVWIAFTAPSKDPTSLYLALGTEDIHLEPSYNPWYTNVQTETVDGECIYIWFYQVEIPAEYLVLGEEESESVRKLAFEIEQENGTTIWMTYTINFS